MTARDHANRFRKLPRPEKWDLIGHLMLIHMGKLMFVATFCAALAMQVNEHYDRLGQLPLDYRSFQTRLEAGEIASVAVSDFSGERRLYVTDRAGGSFAVVPPAFDRQLYDELEANNVSVAMKQDRTNLFHLFMKSLAAALITLIMFSLMRMQFGLAAPTDTSTLNLLNKRPANFREIVGCDEARAEFMEAIDFLRSPHLYAGLGARAPRGILLYGPPGVGKTLLARAAAEEAGACFISRTASDFNDMYVGLAAMKLRMVFAVARRRAPAVIFIDEFETLGRSRTQQGAGWQHREQQATLNQLLAEMDGFTSSDGVLVIAATNHPDDIDSALKRPGRFDRHIHIGAPDQKGRRQLFELFLSHKPKVATDVDLAVLARSTPGLAGAQIEGIVNEAAILAVRDDAASISMTHLVAARDRLMMGMLHGSREVLEQERRVLAVHEAGHALVAHRLLPTRAVERVCITPRGRAGGHTLLVDQKERQLFSKADIEAHIATLLAGRAAEHVLLGEEATTTGAIDDLDKANRLAQQYCDAGFSSKLGLLRLSQGEYAQETLRDRDQAVQDLLEEGLHRAVELLRQESTLLERIATRLLECEVLDGDEFTFLCDRDPVTC